MGIEKPKNTVQSEPLESPEVEAPVVQAPKPKRRMSEHQLEILARGREKRKENLQRHREAKQQTKEVKKKVRKVDRVVKKTFPDGIPEEMTKALPKELLIDPKPNNKKFIKRKKPLQKIRFEVYADDTDSSEDSGPEPEPEPEPEPRARPKPKPKVVQVKTREMPAITEEPEYEMPSGYSSDPCIRTPQRLDVFGRPVNFGRNWR